MTEEFRVVTRKKWISRKPNINRVRHKSHLTDPVPEMDMDKFLQRFEELCANMKETEYFSQAMQAIDESLADLPAKNVSGVERVVCLGIGPFMHSYIALHQLAFIVSAQRKWGIAEAIYFDPVLGDAEKRVLERLDCRVMSENCEGKYKADVATIFYLPHCPGYLINNLLWCNWRPDNLANLVVINNSFDSWTTNRPDRVTRIDSGYILDIMPHTKEIHLDDDYETSNVFNDLSIHIFPLSKLPAPDHPDFWSEREAPSYEGLVGEFSPDDFNKLMISQNVKDIDADPPSK